MTSRGAALPSSRVRIDPLAVSYLRGLGFSPSQIRDWTVGVCSQAVKPAVCSLPSERTAAPAQGVQSGGFDWTDAGIGAVATLGIVLLLAGLGAGLAISRQNRRRPVASV